MAKLIFDGLDKEFELQDGEKIQQACEEMGVPFACSEGICGSCVIEIVDGMENLNPFTEEELDFFGEEGNERLACMCKILGGTVTISI